MLAEILRPGRACVAFWSTSRRPWRAAAPLMAGVADRVRSPARVSSIRCGRRRSLPSQEGAKRLADRDKVSILRRCAEAAGPGARVVVMAAYSPTRRPAGVDHRDGCCCRPEHSLAEFRELAAEAASRWWQPVRRSRLLPGRVRGRRSLTASGGVVEDEARVCRMPERTTLTPCLTGAVDSAGGGDRAVAGGEDQRLALFQDGRGARDWARGRCSSSRNRRWCGPPRAVQADHTCSGKTRSP